MLVASAAPRPRSVASHAFNFMAPILAPCQVNAIAPYEFAELAQCYSIACMKTIGEIRRDNLLLLLEEHKTLANLNENIKLERTDATLSQIKNRNMTSRGKPKAMGNQLARRIEVELKLGLGWMDSDHGDDGFRHERISHAVTAMESMPDLQFDQAIKIIETLSQTAASPSPVMVDVVPAGTIEERDALARRLDALNRTLKPIKQKPRRRNAS